mmetsp:Transcript_104779/g.271442  ORF Transcript_104779/g.271442 Transcript_104779/m.271442 type:complete len:287 (-) Transcript_104779:270-1130(-)
MRCEDWAIDLIVELDSHHQRQVIEYRYVVILHLHHEGTCMPPREAHHDVAHARRDPVLLQVLADLDLSLLVEDVRITELEEPQRETCAQPSKHRHPQHADRVGENHLHPIRWCHSIPAGDPGLRQRPRQAIRVEHPRRLVFHAALRHPRISQLQRCHAREALDPNGIPIACHVVRREEDEKADANHPDDKQGLLTLHAIREVPEGLDSFQAPKYAQGFYHLCGSPRSAPHSRLSGDGEDPVYHQYKAIRYEPSLDIIQGNLRRVSYQPAHVLIAHEEGVHKVEAPI